MKKINELKTLKLFLLISLFVFTVNSIPLKNHPRPDLKRDEWINLNGIWDFSIDWGNSGEERGLIEGKGFNRKILVPFPPESKLSGIGVKDFMNAVWYKRTFKIPENWKDKRILLHFEASDYHTKVWINSKKVGEHVGGFTPFSFDITEFLKSGDNTIIVKAEDYVRSHLQPAGKQSGTYESRGANYTRVTGIWQTVWLEAVGKTYLKKLRVYPDVDNKTVTLELFSAGEPLENGKMEIIIEGKNKIKQKLKFSKHLMSTLKIKKPELWTPDNPYLYKIIVIIKNGRGEIIDNLNSYFGMRKIEAKNGKIYLNDKPIFLRMVLNQGYHQDGIYTAKSDEELRRDIQLTKELGFNGARLHQKVFSKRFIYLSDKMGLLLWGEFGDWGLDKTNPKAFQIYYKQWGEAIERDFNSPSIIGWCPLNEVWRDPKEKDFIIDVFKFTKLMDPTRLIIDTSGGIHYVSPDIYDYHDYTQSPEKFTQHLNNLDNFILKKLGKMNVPRKKQPIFVSEYGGIFWKPDTKDKKAWGYGEKPKTKEEFIERYKRLTEILLKNPRVSGFCYTQLYDIEQESNGLLYYNRKPKFPPAIFYKINTQKAAVEE